MVITCFLFLADGFFALAWNSFTGDLIETDFFLYGFMLVVTLYLPVLKLSMIFYLISSLLLSWLYIFFWSISNLVVYLANVFFLVVAHSEDTGSLVVLLPVGLKDFTLLSLIKLLFLSPLLYSNLGVKVAANLDDLSTRSLNY